MVNVNVNSVLFCVEMIESKVIGLIFDVVKINGNVIELFNCVIIV